MVTVTTQVFNWLQDNGIPSDNNILYKSFPETTPGNLRCYIKRFIDKKKKKIEKEKEALQKRKILSPVTKKTKPPIDQFKNDKIEKEVQNTFINEFIKPENIPTEITTEWFETETLQQYYLATEPKDKQNLLNIIHKIWSMKYKVPSENVAKNDSMEDLYARLSQTE